MAETKKRREKVGERERETERERVETEDLTKTYNLVDQLSLLSCSLHISW